MADTLTRLEAYPFDSRFDGYDEYGYPVFDRSVGSHVLQETFAKFFSDGVFPNPGDNLLIKRGASGMSIDICPGAGIINGGIGGIFSDDPLHIVLDNAEDFRGSRIFSVFLRYDNNIEHRSLYIHVVDQIADKPAEPENLPSVKEIRLGYVKIPTNATSMKDAQIVDERGTQVCPYAAPFERIDLSDVINDARDKAIEQLEQLRRMILEYMQFVDQSLYPGSASYLESQINQIFVQLETIPGEATHQDVLDGIALIGA